MCGAVALIAHVVDSRGTCRNNKGRPKRRFDREEEPYDDAAFRNTFDRASNERVISDKRYGAHVKRVPTKRKKPTSELNPTRPHMHIEYRPSHSAITHNDATIVANEYNKGDKSMAASDEKAFCTLQTTPTSKNAQERQQIFDADMSPMSGRIKSDDDTHIENNVHTL
jgi:hypothetical protein